MKVLLIEDNADLREATTEMLRALGHRVLPASGAEQGSELLASGDRVDLLVANAYPSDDTGLALVARLRQDDPGLRALLLSGYGDDPELRRQVEEGAVALLELPYSAEELNAAVERTAATRPVVTPAPRVFPVPARPVARTAPAWSLAAAAALVLTVGITLAGRAPSPPALPDAPVAEATMRSVTLQIDHPRGELESAPRRLEWRPVDGASSYRVTLHRVDGSELWGTSTKWVNLDLPGELVDELDRAVVYLWSVEALDAEGALLARSAETRFRVRPESHFTR